MKLRLVVSSPDGGQEHIDPCEVVRKKIQEALHHKNHTGRGQFTEALKKQGVPADGLMRLAQEAARDAYGLVAWERKVATMYQLTTLDTVRPLGAFSRLLIVMRELYAQDLAKHVSFEDAARLAIEEILLAK